MVHLLRGKDPEVPSHRFGERVRLEEICCGWLLSFKFCLNKSDCFCVLYLYGAIVPNAYSWIEVDSETLFGVTYGELLAVRVAGIYHNIM